MHYARVPREYWRDRMEKAKAMGLNTITTYVFWNFHEPTPGHFDFSGQRDIAEYLRTAQQVGLHVILRPGPYVCAEWELGGYPGWLFADTSIVLRSTDPKFTKPAEAWLDTLGKVVTPFLASRGGPIIAVQVENEYGSFGKDKDYLRWQLGALRHAGFNDVYLFTADGDVQLPNGTLPELPAVVNFGPGEADSAFARLARFKPGEPLMSGEYWAGWFDQWGQPHHTTNAARQTKELSWMLDRGYSVSIYMFHGGTTPGFMNGANIDGGHYHPQTSSYDYDAALDESGPADAQVLHVPRRDRQGHGCDPAAGAGDAGADSGAGVRPRADRVDLRPPSEAGARRSTRATWRASASRMATSCTARQWEIRRVASSSSATCATMRRSTWTTC